jgi:hypothetical protein
MELLLSGKEKGIRGRDESYIAQVRQNKLVPLSKSTVDGKRVPSMKTLRDPVLESKEAASWIVAGV